MAFKATRSIFLHVLYLFLTFSDDWFVTRAVDNQDKILTEPLLAASAKQTKRVTPPMPWQTLYRELYSHFGLNAEGRVKVMP